MRKFALSAICVMAVALAATVAVVSCKKDDQNTKFNNSNTGQSVSLFDASHITDMDDYLKSFRKKMATSQFAKDTETLGLDEAAWHLSSVANYEFANANVEFTDLRHDTLLYQVNVTDGQVALADLNALYETMAADIDAFYHSLDLQDKHFQFFGASINENGEVALGITTTFVILDHVWYFPDEFVSDTICYYYFCENGHYPWNGLGAEELEHRMNLIESHNYTIQDGMGMERHYYTYTRENVFSFLDNIDPYGSPFCMNSRLLAVEGNHNYSIPFEEMCYCIDSYLGLGYQYIIDNHYVAYEHPVKWEVFCGSGTYPNIHGAVFHHTLKATYGQCHISQDQNEY